MYRGKDIENDNQWRYGSLITYPNGKCVIVTFDNDYNELSYDVDPNTVGEFTELYDKNGKEIYEDDIIKRIGDVSCKEMVAVVEYHGGQFVLGNIEPLYYNMDRLEIIGNIHDNLELLKGGNDEK